MKQEEEALEQRKKQEEVQKQEEQQQIEIERQEMSKDIYERAAEMAKQKRKEALDREEKLRRDAKRGIVPSYLLAKSEEWYYNESILELEREFKEKQDRLALEKAKVVAPIESGTLTYQELLKRPPNIDKTRLESYLSDEEFVKVFNMKKEAFEKLPSWKKVSLKQKARLF